ncbi:hypothetical protein B0J12DRAFT_584088 [Macrophomina phaseolina]|uniref:Zn(2)-C6 fungal-type domain-containing protein n=1 Tax=Macrophomina phaseolina TaxID=35725 RepID=A0ABQ8FXM4_9PEZI|nr:hypothetical protein B0J12DRAFT_584088 [Macrophomina phaseolina]
MAILSTPCHTCRRRRVKCDRALPTCHKCRQSKHECFGYKKLILWSRGIASRGKMMNKTFASKAPQPISALVSAPATDFQPSTSGNPSGESSRLRGPLKDPHLQGLSGSSQFYLYYCKPYVA